MPPANKPTLVTPLLPHQQNCVEVLQEVLSMAMEGKVNSIGVVVCTVNGFGSLYGGNNAAEINLGLDDLKQRLLAEVKTPRRGGSILRA